MKKIYFFYSTFLVVLAISCNKATDFYEELGKGSYLTLVQSVNTNLNANDPASSISMKVNSYGEPVMSVNVYVSATNTLDTTKWKLLKNVPFNGETTLSVTHTEIANALGLTVGNLTPGTQFHLWNQAVLSDGRRFGSYNTSGPDLESQPAFNIAFHWVATVICPFDPAPFDNKTFHIVEDQWQDFVVGDPVQVVLGPGANQITLQGVFPTTVDHKDLVITIDPTTGVATVPRYNYGAYSATGSKYTAATAGSNNFVFGCTQTIDLTLNHVTAGGSNQGNYRLLLRP